jgi:hypothetical protein
VPYHGFDVFKLSLEQILMYAIAAACSMFHWVGTAAKTVYARTTHRASKSQLKWFNIEIFLPAFTVLS